jgi:predicted TIM-barrel fold metal-dependent hydrolase
MPVIDADAHVIETERTWEYMDPGDEKLKPKVLTADDGKRYWWIDGRVKGEVRTPPGARGRVDEADREMAVDPARREMDDISGRVAHMDELGIDIQVLYSSAYISRMCDRPDTEIAMTKSYNRWLADIWKTSKGRLRYSCLLPLSTLDVALEEMRWAAKNGACAVTMRSLEDNRLLVDDYFFPVFEEAQKLNLPIASHIGNSNQKFWDIMSTDGVGGTFGTFRLTSVAVCHAIMSRQLSKTFPTLRFAIVEASSQWVPFVIHDLRRRLETRGRKLADEPLRENNIWVTCQTDDDLPYVLKYAGDTQLVIGTDYGHEDQSSEIQALRNIREKGDVDPAVIDMIMGENAVKLYGLVV